jgi:hypothetical protein
MWPGRDANSKFMLGLATECESLLYHSKHKKILSPTFGDCLCIWCVWKEFSLVFGDADN